jgi:hypothetical protein
MPTPTRALTHKLRPPLLLTLSWLLTWPLALNAMGLSVAPMSAACQRPAPAAPPRTPMPDEARQRLPESQLAHGRHDLGWVWLGEPTRRYPHRALGSIVHAGSVFAQVRDDRHGWRVVEKSLPLDRVYEDRVPRVLDIDQDGQDEILLIEADARRGAALVVLGVDRTPDGPRLVERARGPYAGSSFRWMNPVGVADFDGDGRADLANVVTPHIGGVLQLLHYQPPRLVPFASAMDVSNHRMGALEQALAVIVTGLLEAQVGALPLRPRTPGRCSGCGFPAFRRAPCRRGPGLRSHAAGVGAAPASAVLVFQVDQHQAAAAFCHA